MRSDARESAATRRHARREMRVSRVACTDCRRGEIAFRRTPAAQPLRRERAIGAGLGPWCGIAALAAAFIAGGAYAALLIARGRARRHDAIAFGPFLAAGTSVAAFTGACFPAGAFV